MTVALQDPGSGGKYAFNPSTFNFKVGETVSFTLRGGGEFHTFTVEDLGIDESVDAGQTRTFSFTFNTAGTFQLICIPHETLGMVGIINVQ